MNTTYTVKIKYITILLTVFITSSYLLLINTAESSGEYTSDYTYAYTQIKFRAIGIGSSDIYGRLKLIVPTRLLVDRENTVQAVFELQGGCWPGTWVTFYVVIKYETPDYSDEFTVYTVRFSTECGIPVIQSANFTILIPRQIYSRLKSNIVELTVKDYDVQSPVYIDSKTIVSNVGAYSYIVEYNPIVVLEVQDVSPGYLSLGLNEPGKLGISVKSLNGPVEIRRIEFQQPSFLMVYVYTPLPLNVGVNETKTIEIIVKGASPGAGILRVSVVYYDGVEEKNIAMYVPVIIEEARIYSLIQEYEAKISELENKTSQLEARLGTGLSTTTDISNRLTQLLTRIDSLIDQYQSVVVDVNWLKRSQGDLSRDIATIRQTLDGISNNIGSLRESLLNIGSVVNSIENNYNYLANETDYLKIKTSMNEQKIGAIEQGSTKLYYGVIALGGLLAALYAVVIIYLVKTSR